MRHEVADPVSPGTDSAAGCACAGISGSTLAVTMTGGHEDRELRVDGGLDRVVEEELEHALAQNKTAVVASTTSLATALAKRLVVAVTWFGGSVRNLRIDVSSGK